MAEKTAKIHTHVSNRERPRESKNHKEKKVVFKSSLDSPFRVQWPSVPLNVQNTVLGHLIRSLQGVSEYQLLSKKRKSLNQKAPNPSKRRKLDPGMPMDVTAEGPELPAVEPIDPTPAMKIPSICNHLIYGINEVTKRLELQVQAARFPVIFPPQKATTPPPPLKYVFVCRADVDPPLLISHIPHLIAAYNSVRNDGFIKLIPLPQGAESTLAQALGVRRATILAIDGNFSDETDMQQALVAIPIVSAPWLSQQPLQLTPTHIKHTRTTAPVDMKQAKETRLREKALAKQKKGKGNAVGELSNVDHSSRLSQIT